MIKKVIFLAVAIISNLNLFSQIEKGHIILSLEGNYMQPTTETGVVNNQNTTEGKYLEIGSSIGCFISNKLIAGIGLDYNWIKEYRGNQLMINKYYQTEVTKIKSRVFLPNIYLGYYYPVFNRLYINAKLKFSYGKIKTEYNTIVAGSVYDPTNASTLLIDDSSSSYVSEEEGSSNVDFSSIDIIPELSYYVSSRICVCLGFGGISYSISDWDMDYSSWAVNFNPSYWKFGIKIRM